MSGHMQTHANPVWPHQGRTGVMRAEHILSLARKSSGLGAEDPKEVHIGSKYPGKTVRPRYHSGEEIPAWGTCPLKQGH